VATNGPRPETGSRNQTHTIRIRTRRDNGGFTPVPLNGAPGLFVPTRFAAVIADVVLYFETDDSGQPRCVAYEVTGSPEVDTRRIPLREYIRRSIGAAAGTREELTTPFRGRRAEAERLAAWEELIRRPVGRPRGVGVLGELVADLETVARVARDGAPRGTKAVQDHFSVSRSTALRAKRQAREAGLDVG
jgi:hypothetical protein